MDLSKAKDTFLQEARELLQQFETLLLKAESASLDSEDLGALFRTVHTIKGSAGLFGFEAIVSFCHTVENVLAQLRSGTLSLTPELSQLLLLCRDGISRLVDDAEVSETPLVEVPEAERALQDALASVGVHEETPAKPRSIPVATMHADVDDAQRWHIRVKFGADVLRGGVDPIACLRYLSTLGTISGMQTLFPSLPALDELDPETCYIGFDFTLTSSASLAEIDGTFDFAREGSEIEIKSLTPVAVPAAAPAPDNQPEPEARHAEPVARKPGEGKFLKVEAAKLDRLINLVGELVIAGAAANVLSVNRNDNQMQEAISTISTLIEQIRDGALNMRMVPVGEIFQRFPRVVRDVAHELGKDIELRISGEETELDKSMVEKLTDPLMHIVRNALDHGIEPAAERKSSGKPTRGKIELMAYHESGSVVLEVSDDGGGIRRDKVIHKAVERGLIESGAGLTDAQVYHLLFEPGFSTAEAVTNLSGRGVGMDVVKKNIEALRGEIEIESREGQGTTMRLRLPLTLAIIDGFLVQVGPSQFVIPLDMVLECIELVTQESRYRRYIELRGEVLPYIDVRDIFDIHDAALPSYRYIVVVQYGNKRAGLVVDHLLGELQVVIKPLGKLFRGAQGISGSAILGSGEVALILDVPQLVQVACRQEKEEIEHHHERSHTEHACGK
ncbi:two-component system, chemotaxis family, sensor kinase CheA [Formivibrio citricus]|uniref:Chemotaxis protein CheA n=1 Tax=Formivibrio citricus TaxID=83765 RepID=A0A1I4V6I1_9NEIS|nr:chemotaxis protein CheA [Formivibrio citricus]SFM96809.1 two-component system, chemotaxis family, sensor kinase CheA [Formivibrio citricus]